MSPREKVAALSAFATIFAAGLFAGVLLMSAVLGAKGCAGGSTPTGSLVAPVYGPLEVQHDHA